LNKSAVIEGGKGERGSKKNIQKQGELRWQERILQVWWRRGISEPSL